MKKTTFRVKAFIDTNILVDFLVTDRVKHPDALEVFQLIYTHVIEGAISTQSILDAAYVCKSLYSINMEDFREAIVYMLDRINAGYIDPFQMDRALKDPDADIEDSAQIAFAYDQCCDVVVTNDKQLLGREMPGPMLVMSSEEFLSRCRA